MPYTILGSPTDLAGSPPQAGPISPAPPALIPDNSVTTAKLANGAVTPAKTAERAVVGFISGGNGGTVAGTGFTAVRNAAGDYTITFTTPFVNPVIVCNTNYGNGVTCSIASLSTNSFRVLAFQTSTNAAIDANILFSATEGI